MFFTGLAFLPTLASIHLLSCISMNNQECRIRPQAVNIKSKKSIFFLFSTKTSKCSRSCNSINNPHAKVCVPDVGKNLNLRAFNLISGTTETRHREWHETCKCNAD